MIKKLLLLLITLFCFTVQSQNSKRPNIIMMIYDNDSILRIFCMKLISTEKKVRYIITIEGTLLYLLYRNKIKKRYFLQLLFHNYFTSLYIII